MLDVAREAQLPVVGMLLIVAGAAKLVSRRPGGLALLLAPGGGRLVNGGVGAAELVVGALLLFASGVPGLAGRWLAVLMFVTAFVGLRELRRQRPEADCGCFGELSAAPVSSRTLARAAVCAGASLATIGVSATGWQVLTRPAPVHIAGALTTAAVVALLSPEWRETAARLRRGVPCERREVPVARTLAALRSSAAWRAHARHLTGHEPLDVWREGCWQLVAYPATVDGGAATVVFAVPTGRLRRRPVRAAVVPGDGPEGVRPPDG
ncbi:MauE/DoxX family redox-associated membrane protein [Allonocardiopsis opalescens]|uniref:Methylamine utilisation protein MauE domain-containing protein n=1 Tax=Allonocardiopsis opalescens TaxID=1144618 RepID=A0A2T0Q7F9_9ACTN|nr:MauE/DoxX family redox-associated membrane protein [Allonocardiopsis opalescens]PRX99770.1 hypothetical protein CLV72_103376 [Allonocardiopsis opalescens]